MTRVLFEPLTLRNVEIRNRIWIPPMCQYSVDKQDGVPTTWHLMHLGSFARGGAGLVTVEATGVLPEGRISPQCLGLWNDEQRDAFVPIVDLIHSTTALIPDTDRGALDGDPVWDRAAGPMQIIPDTWRQYAADGNGDGMTDPQQIDDAVLTAARYLCAVGGDLRTDDGWIAAVAAYNDSTDYNHRVAEATSHYRVG